MLVDRPKKYYDLIVVGGGLVGASFSCTLAGAITDENFSILVIEAVVPNKGLVQQASFDARSTALSFGSMNILDEIGLWQQLNDAVTVINEIHVSDKGRLGSVQLNREEQKVDALGYVVENQDLAQVLNLNMEESASISLLFPAVVSSICSTEQGMNLQVEFEEQQFVIDTSLLVLADGGKSPICKQLGIERTVERYEQYALISNIVFEKPHQNIAYERFTDSGPLAVLPLQTLNGKNRGSLVWTLTKEQALAFKEANDERLLQELQERFGYRLGQIKAIGEKFVYPLSLSLAKEQVRPGMVLLGNVAHTLHPVAGQGLNLALRDAEVLVDVLRKAKQQGKPQGQMDVLLEYVERRESDQTQTINFTHTITRLFSSNSEAKTWLRKFGLLAIEFVPILRRSFTKRAMGVRKGS